MGDSTCLMHGFSYASAIPNQSKQGNPMHVLGESISFGRFMTEPLSWDKWSTFPQKKYVEEAARYAQPGSVAAKKAFFEAHYRRIAAQKAAAAALVEQQNAAAMESEGEVVGTGDDKDRLVILTPQFDVVETVEEDKIQHGEVNDVTPSSGGVVTGEQGSGSVYLSENLENQDTVSCSEESGTPQMERPLLKEGAASEDVSVTKQKRSGLSSLKSSIRRKTWKLPSTPAKPVSPHFKKGNNVPQSTGKSSVDSVDKKRSASKSLRGLINLIPIKEPDKEPVSVNKKDAANSGLPPSSSRTPKDCRTPLRTPMAGRKGAAKYPASTPVSENRRIKTPIDPSAAPAAKTTGPKWHILSAVYSKSLTACRNKLQSPTLSTPFTLRTEERAAKRKQKLEEKFNANEEQKAQLQMTLKEKAGNEFRKLGYSFCFKARPLPEFYKEREPSVHHVKKTAVTRPQTVVLGRSSSNKKQQGGTSLMPPSTKPPAKNGSTKNNLSKKKDAKPCKSLTTSFHERLTHENKSPNIQH